MFPAEENGGDVWSEEDDAEDLEGLAASLRGKLRPGGPPVDPAAIHLYIAGDLNDDDRQGVRERIVTWHAWNRALGTPSPPWVTVSGAPALATSGFTGLSMNMSGMEIQSLMVRYCRGDRGCEADLWNRVLSLARQWVGPLLNGPCHRGSVDDVVNEIALQVVQQLARGDVPQGGSEFAWLRTISVRNAHNYFRKWYRRQGKVQLTDPADIDRQGADDGLQQRLETHHLLEEAVSMLQGTDKKIAAGIMAGWEVETMLAETGLSRATFFRRKGRLLKKLGEQLAQLLGLILLAYLTSLLL